MDKSFVNWFYCHKRQIIQYTILCVAVCLCLLSIVQVPVFADVGNNNSYSSSSDSSDSSGGGDLFFIIYLIVELIDIIGPIPTLILICIAAVIMKVKGKKVLETTVNQLQKMEDDYPDEKIVCESIQAVDENFSADDFKQKASECFVTLQKAWTERKWENIRPFETDALFNMHNIQLQEYINNHQINVVERINVRRTRIMKFQTDGDMEILGVRLDARMRDYVTDENGNVIDGNKNKDIYNSYYMEFIRKKGVKTEKGKEVSVTNCPNCGAPTSITSTGRCEYCDSLITTGNFSWVLNELTNFSEYE